jgi:hypothetical protein
MLLGNPCPGVASKVDQRGSDIRAGVEEDTFRPDGARLDYPRYAEAGTRGRVLPENGAS